MPFVLRQQLRRAWDRLHADPRLDTMWAEEPGVIQGWAHDGRWERVDYRHLCAVLKAREGRTA